MIDEKTAALEAAMQKHALALTTGDAEFVMRTRSVLRIVSAIHDIQAVDDDGEPLDSIVNAARAYDEDAEDGIVLPIDIRDILRASR